MSVTDRATGSDRPYFTECVTVGISADNDPDFTDDFCAFLQRSVASVDAAELLILLSKHRDSTWTPRELVAELEPAATLSESDAQRYLEVFLQRGLLSRQADQRIKYQPGSADGSFVATLERLYLERPVTLFRVIYALRDTKIKTFADAFKLRR
jgi:hypothetical protein